MGTVDPFGMTDKLSDTLIQAIVTRLEARGKHQFFMTMLQEYLDVMHIDTASTVIPTAGTMSEKEANEWADTLLKDSEEGVFFGASNYYSYVAKRP